MNTETLERSHVSGPSAVERRVRAHPVRVLSSGSWLCNGADGAINDWLMSDGTVATLSMKEVGELRSNA